MADDLTCQRAPSKSREKPPRGRERVISHEMRPVPKIVVVTRTRIDVASTTGRQVKISLPRVKGFFEEEDHANETQ